MGPTPSCRTASAQERRETVKRLEHVFSCIDKDGSGELSCEEFLEGMNNSKDRPLFRSCPGKKSPERG